MPVIVVGADTEVGRAAVDALLPDAAEVRAFVTDPKAIDPLKALGVKVAVGDVIDHLPRLRHAFERHDRDPETAVVTVYSSQGDPALMAGYHEAGIDRVVVWPPCRAPHGRARRRSGGRR